MTTEIECDYVALQSDAWETSVDAYNAILPALKKVRGQVAQMIHKYSDVPLWNGLVDKEIEDLCTKEYGPRGARTYAIRRIELVSMGLVKWTGETRHPKTVHHEDTQAMNVWRMATPDEIREAMLEANCSTIDEYLEAVAPQNVAKRSKSGKDEEIARMRDALAAIEKWIDNAQNYYPETVYEAIGTIVKRTLNGR